MENILAERNVNEAVSDLLADQLYKQHPLEDKIWISGLGFLGVSLLLFSLSAFNFIDKENAFGIFMFTYLLAVTYFFIQKSNRKYLKRSGFYHPTFGHSTLLLVLSLVSAYTLNQAMFVFQDSTTWLSGYLIIAAMPYIFYQYYAYLPSALRLLFQAATGAGLVLWLYLSLYLIPIYHIGLLAALVLGISLHTFVPLLLFWFGIRIARKTWTSASDKIAFTTGIVVPLVITGFFLGQWYQTDKQITQQIQTLETEDQNHLPMWVRVSQQLEKNWVNQKLISSNLIYVTNLGGSWGTRVRGFDEIKKHDPLVAMASYLYGPTNLSEEEKIKVLEASYDGRHQAQEKLWSGENLHTSTIVTRARIFPDFRLSYTEQTIRIRNTTQARWQNEQEALYTFHLPEGAVVTSLSLWIAGHEEKGYLTTKSKADSAYKTIVGFERRDPSVVHWQEGNTVVVRVFPCTVAEERQFKVGVTAPLRQEKDKLIYENFYFEGPSSQKATETVYLQFNQAPLALETNYALQQQPNQSYRYEGAYQPTTRLSFQAPPLSTAGFTFAGQTYFLSEIKPQYERFTPAAIYLDVNQSWTEAEWKAMYQRHATAKVYVYIDGFVQVTPQNQEKLFNLLKNLQFSLFPIYQLPKPAEALLITKSNLAGPNLQDLKGSDFAEHLITYLQASPRLHIFNLSSDKSDYIRTLKELRAFIYDEGSPEKLTALLQKHQFLKDPEDAASVALAESQVKITATTSQGQVAGTAPDHLLRLFAYNNIMKKMSPNYFKPDVNSPELISEAATANVVSPVSSLVVLETQQDYKRFDITKSKDSLGNATAKAAGSVPEPHEWLLILLAVIIIGYLLGKPYLKSRLV